jgi:hypothetical protein
VAVVVSEANGTSERECALKMVKHVRRRHRMKVATLGADAGYGAEEFLLALEGTHVTPPVALRKPGFGRGVEGGEARPAMRRRQRRAGYWRSQRRRKVVEEFFAWAKTVSMLRRSRHVGHWKITQQLEITAAAFNLVRMRSLLAA